MGLLISPLVIDVPEQTYSGTIAWTGTTAPSGATTHTYQWTQIGKLVTLRLNLKYAVAGSALTAVTMVLPSDCPTPALPTGFTAASNNLVYGTGSIVNSLTLGASTANTVKLAANAANNAYHVMVFGASSAHLAVLATIQYWST